MKVLSLFDGISCGQQALKEANIAVDTYYASEIDKHAIKVTKDNFPNTRFIGDVRGVNGYGLPKIDLVIGGSPCQGFSFSGKQLNFNDPRSKLFFEFVRIVKETQPKYWLLENVVMRKDYEKVITEHLGVEPVKLNSALTSAQNRVRLYWANFPIKQPQDCKVNLNDILQGDTLYLKAAIRGRRLSKDGKRVDLDKTIPITQYLEVTMPCNKCNCLTTVAKDTVVTTLWAGRYADPVGNNLPFRHLTTVERCRLMNLPDDYCKAANYSRAVSLTGNAWDVGMVSWIFKEGIK